MYFLEQQLPGETHLASSQQGPQEPDDDPHRLAAADIYVQDAIEYIEAQRPPSQSGNGGNGGFVIEEDMLESDKHSPQPPPLKDIPAPNLSELEKQLKSPSEAGKQLSQQNISADPTSRMIRTNEVGEDYRGGIKARAFQVFTARPDPSFDDADDAITSAPEIQSIEIPPDQMSENSSNIMDNYDYQVRPSLEITSYLFLSASRLRVPPPLFFHFNLFFLFFCFPSVLQPFLNPAKIYLTKPNFV